MIPYALTNVGATTILPGQPVVHGTVAGMCQAADVTNVALSSVLGLAYDQAAVGAATRVENGGIMALSPIAWDAVVPGQVGGLSPGVTYYAGPNGAVLAAPSTSPGSVIVLLGIAIQPAVLIVQISRLATINADGTVSVNENLPSIATDPVVRAQVNDLERRFRLLLADHVNKLGVVPSLGEENVAALATQ